MQDKLTIKNLAFRIIGPTGNIVAAFGSLLCAAHSIVCGDQRATRNYIVVDERTGQSWKGAALRNEFIHLRESRDGYLAKLAEGDSLAFAA